MAIWLYTGTPGSGKSLHASKDIARRLKRDGGLIMNFPVNRDFVKRPKADVIYLDNSELSPAWLVDYARKHHEVGKEGQSLVVIDEAQVVFNCRDFCRKDRTDWVKFFSQHRKFGYNVILITQNDRMLDKQIRSLVEIEIRHRKLNNYGFGGFLLSLVRISAFVAIEYWYGGNKLKLSSSMFTYTKKYSTLYDSYMFFDGSALDGEGLPPVAGGGPALREGPGDGGQPPPPWGQPPDVRICFT